MNYINIYCFKCYTKTYYCHQVYNVTYIYYKGYLVIKLS